MKQTVFAVPMTCDSCVKDVSDTLHKLQGIRKVEANLQAQLVSVEGTGMDLMSPTIACITVRCNAGRWRNIYMGSMLTFVACKHRLLR